MTLLLITILNAYADDQPKYAPVTVIDFEAFDINADIDKPQITFVRGTKSPESEPGDLIQMFIIEPSKRHVTPVTPEEMPVITVEK